MQQVMHWKKGTVDICATSLVTAITVNITKNGINETLSRCHVLYITRTHFSCRFRIWSQKSDMGSVSSVMGWFVMNGSLYGWFAHSKFSNRRYHKSHCQSVVLYIKIMGEKSFHHCCPYCLSDRSNGDNHPLCPYISHFLGMAGLIPSSNMFDTLHHKSIEWPKRVYFEIPCIDECRCRKVPQMLHCAIFYP